MTERGPAVAGAPDPRAGRGAERRRLRASAPRHRGPRSRLRIAALVASAIGFSGALLAGGAVGGMAMLDATLGSIPEPIPLAANSVVYDRGGAVLAELHPDGESRVPVPLDQVSRTLQRATVDIEDRNFYREGAIDPGRLVAAAWQDLVHRDTVQGASTITEQLVKVRYLGDYTRSFSTKIRELFVARRLDGSQSKEQILGDYLNSIFYGHGATGIEAAARSYFGTNASRLDLAQASLLAGLPNAPTSLDPYAHLADARARQRQVLQAMVEAGDISPAQADEAANEPLKLSAAQIPNLAPAFVARVVDDLRGQVNGVDPYRSGLAVHTTLDLGLQQIAQDTVRGQVDGLADRHVTDGAVVVTDPSTGAVLAYVGSAGPSHPGSEIDLASSKRQPGSTFKLFTYTAAIAAKKVTMLTPVLDAPYQVSLGSSSQPYVVHDYDGHYHGTVPVSQALGSSLNVPAVKVEQQVGIPQVLGTARSLGVTTLTDADGGYGPSLTLGSYPVPLVEMAQAAGAFAQGGVLHAVRTLNSVTDSAGHQLLPPPAQPRQAIDPGVTFIMNKILTDDRNRASAFGRNSDLVISGHTVAAKTGTTQDFKDNLTVGWTPHVAVATWVGNADSSPMQGTTGLTGAAPIWHQVMEHALGTGSDDWPGQPGNVEQHRYGGQDGWFLSGTSPNAGLDKPPTYLGDCRFWTFNGGSYYYCGDQLSDLPGDPGPRGGQSPSPTPSGPPGRNKPNH